MDEASIAKAIETEFLPSFKSEVLPVPGVMPPAPPGPYDQTSYWTERPGKSWAETQQTQIQKGVQAATQLPEETSDIGVMETLGSVVRGFNDFMKMTGKAIEFQHAESGLSSDIEMPPEFQEVLGTPEEIKQKYEKQAQEAARGYVAAAESLEKKRPDFKGQPVMEFIYDTGSVIRDMVPALATGAVTKNPNSTLLLMGLQADANEYMRRRAAGETQDEARLGSVYTGLVEAWTEKLPVGILFKKGTPALQRVLGATVGEGAQEAASSLLQSAWDKGTIDPDMTLTEALRAAGYEGAVGTAAGGVMGAGAAGVHSITDRAQWGRELQQMYDEADAFLKDSGEVAREAMNPPQGVTRPRLKIEGEAEAQQPSDEAQYIPPKTQLLEAPVKPEETPKVEYADTRLKREGFRDLAKKYVYELEEGGGISVIPQPGWTRSESEGAEPPKIRTKSVNPQWAQDVMASTGLTVRQLRGAVDKAIAGKKLGIRQQNAVAGVLDQISGERSNEAEILRRQLQETRKARGQANLPVLEDWEFTEESYAPESNETGRAIQEIYEHIREKGTSQEIDKAERLMESQREDSEVLDELAKFHRTTFFHGSPYQFTQFDVEKVGTGEGAAAFGWGAAYLAQSPGVAKSYQQALTPAPGVEAEKYVSRLQYKTDVFESVMNKHPDYNREQVARLADNYSRQFWSRAEKWNTGDDPTMMKAWLDDKQKFAEGLKKPPYNNVEDSAVIAEMQRMPIPKYVKPEGYLYEVEVPDEVVARMLDWDAPLSEQATKVKEAIKSMQMESDMPYPESWTGQQIYKDMVSRSDQNPQAASEWLNEAGIPGIKYLDQQSREEGEGTRNIVVFDPDLLTIRKRNGEVISGRAKQEMLEMGQEAKAEETKGEGTTLYANPIMPILRAYEEVVDQGIERWNNAVGWRYTELGKLPSQRLYLAERYKTLGTVSDVERIAHRVYKAFRNVEQSQQVYDYLTSEVDERMIENEEIRHEAKAVKTLIRKVGKGLVDRGLLDEGAYEAHKDKYLPRLYLKHLLGTEVVKALQAGKKPSKMGYLKQRKDIPEEVRELILGEITDPAFLASTSLGTTMRDIAILDFFERIAQEPEWVFPKSLVEWEGKNVSVFWLEKQAEDIQKQAGYYTEENRKKALEIADRMMAVVKPALEETGKVTKDYKQVPDTKRYGRLRGMYIRKEIYDDMIGSGTVIPSDVDAWQSMFGYGGIGTTGTQLWKMSKVALNPPAQFRNFVSNGVLVHLSGVNGVMIAPRMVEAINSIATNGRYWRIAKKYGVTAASFAQNELFRIKEDLLDFERRQSKGAFSSPTATITHIAGIIGNRAGDVYQASEALWKTVKIIDEMKKGVSEQDAAMEAHKWLYDYSMIPPVVRSARNMPLGAPFITFYYKTLPRIAETVLKRPWKFAPYIAMPYIFAAMIADDYEDVSVEDVKVLMKTMPTWLQDKGHGFLLPYKDENGRWQAVDFGYILPWAMFEETVKHTAKGSLGEAVQTSGIIGGPIPDMMTAILTNKDAFTGRDVINQTDPVKKQIYDGLTYIYDMAMPTWLTSRGAVGRTIDAMQGAVDPRTGEVLDTPNQAAARLFGFNVYPFDPKLSRQKNLYFMDREIKDIKARGRWITSDRNLTKEEKKEITGDYIELLKDKAAERKKYAEESKVKKVLH